jgi:hypothetical protein
VVERERLSLPPRTARPESTITDEREDTRAMRIDIHEAEASTSERPLWIWRIWRTGRLTQGFSPSEKEAKHQADLAQHPGHGWRG